MITSLPLSLEITNQQYDEEIRIAFIWAVFEVMEAKQRNSISTRIGLFPSLVSYLAEALLAHITTSDQLLRFLKLSTIRAWLAREALSLDVKEKLRLLITDGSQFIAVLEASSAKHFGTDKASVVPEVADMLLKPASEGGFRHLILDWRQLVRVLWISTVTPAIAESLLRPAAEGGLRQLITNGNQLARGLEAPTVTPVLAEALLKPAGSGGLRHLITDGKELVRVLETSIVTPALAEEFLKPASEGGFRHLIMDWRQLVRVLWLPTVTPAIAESLLRPAAEGGLRQLITNGNQLARGLEAPTVTPVLAEALLKPAGSGLRHLITDGDQLASVLGYAPFRSPIALVPPAIAKSLLKPESEGGLRHLIADGNQLASVLETSIVTPALAEEFLKPASEGGFRHLITDGKELATILETSRVTPALAEELLKSASEGGLRHLITDGKELARVLKAPTVTPALAEELLKPASEGGFRHKVTDGKELASVLSASAVTPVIARSLLKPESEGGLRELIANDGQLELVLKASTTTPASAEMLLRPEFEDVLWGLIIGFSQLKMERLFWAVIDWIDKAATTTPEIIERLLMPALDGRLRPFITDGNRLATVLCMGGVTAALAKELLKLASEGGFRHLITDGNQLVRVLRAPTVTPALAEGLLKPASEGGLRELIADGRQLEMVLSGAVFPYSDATVGTLEAVNALLSSETEGGLRHLIIDGYQLWQVLSVPAVTPAIAETLLSPAAAGGLRHLITNGGHLARVLMVRAVTPALAEALLRPGADGELRRLMGPEAITKKYAYHQVRNGLNRKFTRIVRSLVIPRVTIEDLNGLIHTDSLTSEQQNLLLCLFSIDSGFVMREIVLSTEPEVLAAVEEESKQVEAEEARDRRSRNNECVHYLIDSAEGATYFVDNLKYLPYDLTFEVSLPEIVNLVDTLYAQASLASAICLLALLDQCAMRYEEGRPYVGVFDQVFVGILQNKQCGLIDQSYAWAINFLRDRGDRSLRNSAYDYLDSFVLGKLSVDESCFKAQFPKMYLALRSFYRKEFYEVRQCGAPGLRTMSQLKCDNVVLRWQHEDAVAARNALPTEFFRHNGFLPGEGRCIMSVCEASECVPSSLF